MIMALAEWEVDIILILAGGVDSQGVFEATAIGFIVRSNVV